MKAPLESVDPNHPRHPPGAWLCIRRALRLRCPECGISPIFVPMRRVRSLWDLFTPLDGCPRCGYAYEREQGYFLLATWGINYGLIGGIGLAISLVLQTWFNVSLRNVIICVCVPMALASTLFVRHSKALFLAMDHYFDPHVKSDV